MEGLAGLAVVSCGAGWWGVTAGVGWSCWGVWGWTLSELGVWGVVIHLFYFRCGGERWFGRSSDPAHTHRWWWCCCWGACGAAGVECGPGSWGVGVPWGSLGAR